MTHSNLDLARECGAYNPQHEPPGYLLFSPVRIDAFAERIRADERASLALPVGMPEIEAEQFIQAAIDSAPDQFRRLGEFLARILEEDQWKLAERLILGGLVEIQEGRDVLGDIDHYNENIGKR